MADDDNDIPLEQEAEEMEAEVAVAVAVAPQHQPISNGNGHRQVQQAMPTIQRSEVITHPPQPFIPQLPPPVRRPAPVARRPVVEKETDARELLESIVYLPESIDWILRVHRMPGVRTVNNEPAKSGYLETFEVMHYEGLVSIIAQSWGGGEFKVIACDKNTGSPILDNPKVRVIWLSIPTDQYAPKSVKGAADAAPALADESDEDEELKIIDRESKRDVAEERRSRARLRKLSTDLEMATREDELRRKKKALSGETESNSNDAVTRMIDEIRRQQEKDRENLERRMQDSQRDMAAMMKDIATTLSSSIKDVATLAAAKKDDSGMEKFLLAMQQSQSSMLAAIVPALTQKPPDNANLQIEQMKMQQASTQNLIEVMSRVSMKENNTNAQMMQTMISIALKPRDSANQLTPELMMKLMDRGENKARDWFRMARGDDNDAPEDPNAWNPKLGFMGNMGKQLLSTIKDIAAAAMNNPQAQQAILRMFGKANPSEEEQVVMAQRMEAEENRRMMLAAASQLPQPVAPQPVAPQAAPMQVRPQQQVAPQQQAPQRAPIVTPIAPQQPQAAPMRAGSMPGLEIRQRQSVQAVQAAPPVDPELQARVDAQDLEGQITGLDLSGIGTLTTPAPELPVTVEAPQAVQPALPPAPVPQAEAPVMDDSEERLRERISDTMELAMQNVKDQIKVHDWPEDAFAKWNGPFLQLLVATADDEGRFKAILDRCDQEVASELLKTLEASRAEPPQWTVIYNGVRELIDMVKRG